MKDKRQERRAAGTLTESRSIAGRFLPFYLPLPFYLLSLIFSSCSSPPAAPAYTPFSSSARLDPARSKELLAVHGDKPKVDVPKVRRVRENQKDWEIHTLRVDPKIPRSTFQLVRYFLAPEDWILMKVTYHDKGYRTYQFRRVVTKGPRLEVDPFKPPVGKKD